MGKAIRAVKSKVSHFDFEPALHLADAAVFHLWAGSVDSASLQGQGRFTLFASAHSNFFRRSFMAQLLALYKTPSDKAAFDQYYESTHLPLAKTLPGLRKYELSSGPVASGAGASDLHLVAILSFDSLAAIESALGTPEGQATAADLANFAQAGVELLMFDSKEV